MRLKKLTISNIASIEQAEIDFNASPLAEERLFLITGETGAGKSTIIDCLCLALYGNTPRLKSGGRDNYENGQDKNLGITDPRQLLRRGAGQARIELTFDDNDDVPYIAIWEVHRAHNKPDGSLQDVKRVLRTDEGVLPAKEMKGKTEIKEYIEQLIGLDMEQFFRTVVLAQGKFAEFLSSGESDKAALLEKMTGTEIYSRISTKIYEEAQEKTRKRDSLLTELENIEPLTEEQKTHINNELKENDLQHKAIQQQFDNAKKMADWLDASSENERQLATIKAEFEQKLTEESTPAHIKEQQLIKDWDATTEARQQWRRQQEALNSIKALEGLRPAMQEEYDVLCAALRTAIADIEEKQKKSDEIGIFLQREEPYKEMYSAISQIKSLKTRLDKANQEIAQDTEGMEKDQALLPEVKTGAEAALKTYQEQEETLKKLQGQYHEMKADELEERRQVLSDAKQAMVALNARYEAIVDVQTALARHKTMRQEEQTELEKQLAVIEGKRVIEAQAREAVERQKDWNALLNKAHQTLQPGADCPVCGKKIDQLLAPQKGEDKLKKLEQAHKTALDDLQHTEVLIKTIKNRTKDLNKLISDGEEDLNKKNSARESQWQETRQALEKCGKKADEMANQAQSEALIREIDAQVEQLNAQLKQAKALNDQIVAAQKQLTENAKEQNLAEKKLNTLIESINSQNRLIKKSREDVLSMTEELNKLLVEDWRQRLADNDDFIEQLEKAATDYQNMVSTLQQLNEHIKVQRTAIPTMEKSRANIGLKDNGLKTDGIPDDLGKRWHELENSFLEWNTQLAGALDIAENSRQALDVHLKRLPDITLERLAEVEECKSEQITGLKQTHQALKDAINTMRGAINTLEKQQTDLKAQRPNFPEQNREKLDELIDMKSGELEALNTHIADLKAKLIADQACLEQQGKKRQELEKADAEHRQWDQFNRLLGSRDGSKFRKIAQSYILGELLASANEHLLRFNDRYQLESSPSSLLILVRDQVQGSLTSVNTLSGGESFMVALALALALSGLSGKLFSMDTLFIDEGFGSLSPSYLDNVMETLNRLYEMGGRRVGIISHVEMLKERVPTQIKVFRSPENNTVSLVEVTH